MNGIKMSKLKRLKQRDETKKCRHKNTETEKIKKIQNDENVEKLEDVLNKQLSIEMCSIDVDHFLIICVTTVHCVKRIIGEEIDQQMD